MVAVQVAGGMPVPLYQDAISRSCSMSLTTRMPLSCWRKTRNRSTKSWRSRTTCPRCDASSMTIRRACATDRALIRFTEVQAQGQQLDKKRPGLFHELVAAGKPDDVA